MSSPFAGSIDADQPVPIYVQLKALLLDEIREGRWAPGEQLPTEHELCALLRISRTPVSRALSELAASGVVVRQRRRGTFVNPHWQRGQPERPELRVVVQGGGRWARVLRRATPEHLRVDVVEVPWYDLHRATVRAVGEGRGPDLAVIDSAWVPEFTAAGFLRPLDELDEQWARREHTGDFLPSLAAVDRVDGRLMAASVVADVAGLWCRLDALAGVGLAPPRTWDELRAAVAALSAAGVERPLVLPAGDAGGEVATFCLVALLASNGASVVADERVTLSSPATVDVLALLRDLVRSGGVPADVVGLDWSRAARQLADGRAAMSVAGSYEAAVLAGHLGVPVSRLGEHLRFVPVPAGPRGPAAVVTGTMALAVLRQAARPELAMQVLTRAVSAPMAAHLARRAGRLPPRRSVLAASLAELPHLALSADAVAAAVTRPVTTDHARLAEQVRTMFEDVIAGRAEPAAAAAVAADRVAAVTGFPVAVSSSVP